MFTHDSPLVIVIINVDDMLIGYGCIFAGGSLCINAIIQCHDSLRWLAIIQCNGSLLSLVIILLHGSLPLLAVMLKIGSLRFVDCMLPSGSLTERVIMNGLGTLYLVAVIIITDSLQNHVSIVFNDSL